MIPVPYDQDTDPTDEWAGWADDTGSGLVYAGCWIGLLVLAGMAVFGALWLTTGWTP